MSFLDQLLRLSFMYTQKIQLKEIGVTAFVSKCVLSIEMYYIISIDDNVYA